MPTEPMSQWAILARRDLGVAGSPERTGGLFVARIIKITDDYIWYEGPYSAKKIARLSCRVAVFDSRDDAVAKRDWLLGVCGHAEVKRLEAELSAARERSKNMLSLRTAGMTRGDENPTFFRNDWIK